MPIYEYACRDCKSEFEVLLRGGGDQPDCPSCGGASLDRLLSVPAAHTTASSSLPVCQPAAGGGCGLPECGMGGCQMP